MPFNPCVPKSESSLTLFWAGGIFHISQWCQNFLSLVWVVKDQSEAFCAFRHALNNERGESGGSVWFVCNVHGVIYWLSFIGWWCGGKLQKCCSIVVFQ